MPEETLSPFDPTEDFFGTLQDYKPETNEDGIFNPITGRYVARIARLTHNIGVSTSTNEPYDFYALNLQVKEIIDGDKAVNRYLSKRYNNNPDGLKKLMNDLFTAGLEFDKTSRETFDLGLSGLVDKLLNIRCWVWTPEKDRAGNIIPEDERNPIQQFVIVKEFKGKKSSTGEAIPF